MRVMCIEKPMQSTTGDVGLPSPEVGDEDIVTGDKHEFGVDWFFLERFGDELSYAKRCFATLDGPDETKLVTEEFEEKYCVPA